MHKGYIKLGAMLAMLSVLAGAFGAHSLKSHFPESVITIFETAVRYQFYHAIALLITGILYLQFPNKQIRYAAKFFILGIILFSGSLYILTFIKGHSVGGLDWIGILTPIGGLFFVAGWIFMIVGVREQKKMSGKSEVRDV